MREGALDRSCVRNFQQVASITFDKKRNVTSIPKIPRSVQGARCRRANGNGDEGDAASSPRRHRRGRSAIVLIGDVEISRDFRRGKTAARVRARPAAPLCAMTNKLRAARRRFNPFILPL